ncbi:Uncharacterised protein [Serratia ficaria]|nr:Uncharacterised protein [Serratia ficaria]
MDFDTVSTSVKPTLHLLCGKIASGKSTLSAKLGALPGFVIISEDDWLATLYANEMQSVADYIQCSSKLRIAMKPHLVALPVRVKVVVASVDSCGPLFPLRI